MSTEKLRALAVAALAVWDSKEVHHRDMEVAMDNLRAALALAPSKDVAVTTEVRAAADAYANAVVGFEHGRHPDPEPELLRLIAAARNANPTEDER